MQTINDLAEQIYKQRTPSGKAPKGKVESLLDFQSAMFKAYDLRHSEVTIAEKTIIRAEALIKEEQEYPKQAASTFYRLYQNYINNTLEAQIAEAAMCLLNYAASRNIQIDTSVELTKPEAAQFKRQDFIQIILNTNAAAECLYDMKLGYVELSDLIKYLEVFAIFNGFDLQLHIQFRTTYQQMLINSPNQRRNILKAEN